MAASMKGPRAKIERAKKHVRELEAALGGLVISKSTHPQVIVTELDADTGNLIYKIARVPRVPDEVAAIAGDAIHNLRSSLDLLMSQLVERHTGNPGDLYYPTGGNRKTFEARCATEVKPWIHQDALKLVRASEAYHGGNGDAAWCVHRLDIEDKHRVVYELGFHLASQTLAFPVVSFDMFTPEQNAEANRMIGEQMDSLFWHGADTMFPLKDGDVLFTGAAEPTNDPKFRLDVTFSEPQIVHAEPVLPAITQLGQAIEAIVESFAGMF
jgi:hypothetical protein